MSTTGFIRRFKRVAPYLGGAVWLGMASCTGGTETGNPVLSFSGSDCHQPSSGIAKGGDGGLSEPEASALHCFAWELDADGVLQLEVSNMDSGCMVNWYQSSAQWQAGVLRLEVENLWCDTLAACGAKMCVYDLSFEIGGVEPGTPLPISLWKRYTCDSAERDADLTLPLDREPKGVLCQEPASGRWE